MDRSQQKCLFASMGGHLSLFLIFVFGSAFLISKPPPEDRPASRFYPSILVDALVAGGGGNPNKPMVDVAPGGAPPVSTPEPPPEPTPTPPEPPVAKPVDPTPTPTPTPPPPEPPKSEEKTPTPEKPPTPIKIPVVKSPTPKHSVKEPVTKPKDTPDKTVTAPPKPTHKPQTSIDLDLNKTVVRDNEAQKKKEKARQKAQEEAERKAQEEAYATAKAAADSRKRAFQDSLASLGTGFSKDKGVAVEVGGPGGEAYENYGAALKQTYDKAWDVSSSLADDNATAEVTIVILKSGEIASARISRRSGVPAFDKTVETALTRVQRFRAFPEGAKDEQRSFRLRFNLKAKRSSG